MTRFAVIEERSISHEGDERSRTNPGHGYPAYNETVHEFREFSDEDEMTRYVQRAQKFSFSPKYKIIRFEELTVRTTVTVDVGDLK